MRVACPLSGSLSLTVRSRPWASSDALDALEFCDLCRLGQAENHQGAAVPEAAQVGISLVAKWYLARQLSAASKAIYRRPDRRAGSRRGDQVAVAAYPRDGRCRSGRGTPPRGRTVELASADDAGCGMRSGPLGYASPVSVGDHPMTRITTTPGACCHTHA